MSQKCVVATESLNRRKSRNGDVPFKRKDYDEPDRDDPERVGEEEECLATPMTEDDGHPDAPASDPRQTLVQPVEQDEEQHARI